MLNAKNQENAMLVFALCAVALPMVTMAEEAAPEITAADAMFTVNNTWMMVATFLVSSSCIWALPRVETGLTRAKNTVNILFKNTAIVAIGLLTYTVIGFNLMYPGFAEGSAGFFGFAGFGLQRWKAPTACHRLRGRCLYLLDRLPVPGHVCGHGGYHCFGCGCRARETWAVPDLLHAVRCPRSTRGSVPGNGAAAGWTPKASTISPVPPSSTPSADGAHWPVSS
jgi:hypothetical protein